MNTCPHDYPGGPGHRGIGTSMEAADAIRPVQSHLQRMALTTIRDAGPHGLTTNELAERLGIDRGTIQPRTSELKVRGLICDSGQRRPNRNGKRAIVWAAVEGGVV